jgi:hypothetical protein
MNLHPLFLLVREAQKKKLGKKKHAVLQGAARPLHPSPPFEKGGRKLSNIPPLPCF